MTPASPLAAVVLLLAVPTHGYAQAGPPMDDPALAATRGGIQTPFGQDIGFGATVRTSVDGRIALETQLTWTPQGVQTQTFGDPSVGGGAPVGLASLIPGVGGATQVTHELTADRISSLVINTASNRTIRQDTNITLTLPQLPDLQRQVAADRIVAGVQSAVGLALRTPK